MTSIASSAAAQTTGFPPNVPPRLPGPGRSMTAGFPVTPPNGNPPPTALPLTRMSGTVFQFSIAHSFPVRPIPACTSSSTRTMPWASHSLRRSGRNSLRVAVGVCVVREDHLSDEGTESLAVRFVLPREADVKERASVECGLEGDEPRPLRRGPRDLDGVLNRLGPGVEEDRLRQARRTDLRHARRQLGVRPVRRHHEGDVRQPIQFVFRGTNDRRWTVARGLDADPASQVDVDIAIGILDEGTFRERDVDGKGDLDGVRDELLFPRHRGFRLRSGWDRNDLRPAQLLPRAFRHGIVARARPVWLWLALAERDGTNRI